MECANEHERAAEFRCIRCGMLWCGDCVSALSEHSRVKTCPECADMAVPLAARTRHDAGLLAEVGDALRAPFEMPAASITVIGGVLSCFSLVLYWLHPYAAVLFGVVVLGYFNAYAASIANNTVQDLIDPFGWDVTDDAFRYIYGPSGRVIVMLGAVAAVIYGAQRFLPPVALPYVAGLMAIWLPMAWFRATLCERLWSAFSPSVWLAIVRTLPGYLLSTAAFYLVVGVPIALFVFEPRPLVIPLVFAVPLACIVYPRVLGLLYLHNAERIDWFDESARYYTPIR